MKDPAHNEPRSHALPPEDVIRRRVKAELRKRMRGLRNATPKASCDERSRKIVATLEQHPFIVEATSVALFFPIEERHEVDLRPLDIALRAKGKVVGYPAIDPETDVMTFHAVSDLDALVERGKGFREPEREAPLLAPPDVVIVPSLAIAPSGHRIGYGRGYYDRALETLSATGRRFHAIVVAFEFQTMIEIPVTEGDVAIEWIVTDERSEPRSEG